ncbi:site-specific integrase [Vibrio sp. ABG19]|uniref:tyrosine-type recombinase/integrase n=1 Tax=Vibrio sp. ABG19 TaxID=2817385 RepID=UPI00249EC843|nr:site-specific integrase [Vibrio sp. ABG19]WGY45260.1 integrase arm-type DNA-binding domain-containing protein [Vibrio sp. ABG19]
MKLTDAWLRANAGRPYSGKSEITYKNGLGIRVSPKGKITWIYRFVLRGSSAKMKIGEYPAMKIRDAQEERDRLAELVFQNVDPRNKQAIRLGENAAVTVSQVIDHYIENQLKHSNQQWPQVAQALNVSVKPHIGEYELAKIELSDFVELFRRERQRAGEKHSARLLPRLKTVMNYAVRNGFIKYNALAPLTQRDVGEKSQPRKTKLSEIEVGAFWTKIHSLPYHNSMINFLALTMIFASRSAELRLAKKEHIDWTKKIWTVPVENNKIRGRGGNEIVRPIPKLAEEILRRQIAMFPEAEYLFPRYYRYKDVPFDPKTPYRPSIALAQAMEDEGFTGSRNHDMRRTARNAWEMMRFPYHVSETMLGHKVHRGTQAHYLDYAYVDEQRECYERWCEYILEMADEYQDKAKSVVMMAERKVVNI